MNDKRTKTPQLRFAGYTDDWEERELNSITDRVKSYSLSRDVEMIEYTGYKYVHYGDIHTKVASVINESSDLPNIKAGDYDLLEQGDLVIADASEDYQGIATPAVITIDTPYKLVSGLHTIALRPKKVDSLYLYYLIKSPTFRKYGYKTGTGMKVFGISVSNLLKFEGMFPSLQEQVKIGNFFVEVDNLITLQQQKLGLLKETKKSLLQKMFPREGANVPEVRFTGYTDAWEQRNFFDNIEKTIDFRGRTPKKLGLEWSESGYLALSALNVKNGYIDYSAEAHFGDGELYRKWMKGNELKKGQVLFTTEAPMGNVTQIPDDKGYILSQRTIAFVTKAEKLSDDFLAVLLKSPNVYNKLSSFSSGGTAKGVSQRSLKALEVKTPIDTDEQKKMGILFKEVNYIITLQQRELNALKNLKKSLLHQMFV